MYIVTKLPIDPILFYNGEYHNKQSQYRKNHQIYLDGF
jgi:hypothetical protein